MGFQTPLAAMSIGFPVLAAALSSVTRLGLGRYAGSAPRRSCEPGTGPLNSTDVEPMPGDRPGAHKGSHGPLHRLRWRWEEMSPRYICSMSDVFFVQIGGNCGLNVPRCAIGGDPISGDLGVCDPVPRVSRRGP